MAETPPAPTPVKGHHQFITKGSDGYSAVYDLGGTGQGFAMEVTGADGTPPGTGVLELSGNGTDFTAVQGSLTDDQWVIAGSGDRAAYFRVNFDIGKGGSFVQAVVSWGYVEPDLPQ